METKTHRKPFFSLLIRFINSEIQAPYFVRRFMKLWKENRDLQEEVKKTWEEPYDLNLKMAFLRKEISKEEFIERWNELWGLTSETEREFQEMIGRIFTACDVYRDRPELKYEIDENQLRAFVAESLASYLQILAKPSEVSTR